MARKPSDPDIRKAIMHGFIDHGTHYVIQPGQVVYPSAPQDGPGMIILADDTQELRQKLDLEHVPLNKFQNALGSLMYHYKSVMRCHIDGDRHYKLIVGL